MNVERVESREYKIMLQAVKFGGSEEQLVQTARTFWVDFSQHVREHILEPQGDFTLKKRRCIRFYDTSDHHLRVHDYVFRERTLLNEEEPEATLKFRHADRYVAQDRDMQSWDEEADSKFEEDIKTPQFTTLYSFSSTMSLASPITSITWKELAEYYPDVSNHVTGIDAQTALERVANFTARELVLSETKFKLSPEPKVTCKCALVVWYHHEHVGQDPVVVEFSFRYKDKTKQERFPGHAAMRAYRAFIALQEMEDWVDLDSKTKTAFVYDLAS